MNNNKKIEEFLESKLRNAETHSVSGDFNKGLMFRIREENNLAKEESRTNRIAKYIIGMFSSLVVGFTILIGILSGSQPSTKTSASFSFEPTIETSNNYLNQFLTMIQDFFNKVLELLGLSYSSQTIGIIAGLIIAVSLFMLADRLFVKGKLKSR